jgi:N-acetylneuraminate synthase
VAIRDIAAGETLTRENVWVKRPGTGEIKAASFEALIGRVARHSMPVHSQLRWTDLEP